MFVSGVEAGACIYGGPFSGYVDADPADPAPPLRSLKRDRSDSGVQDVRTQQGLLSGHHADGPHAPGEREEVAQEVMP